MGHMRDNRRIMSSSYILTLSCPDRLGLVHAVSGFLLERGGNIEEAAQYNDHDTGLFFMRVQFVCDQHTQADLHTALRHFASGYAMQWSLHATAEPMRTGAAGQQRRPLPQRPAVSLESGLLRLDIGAIISNHRDFYQLAASYNVPFHHIPVTADNKAQAEDRQAEIIEAVGAELVVLARYMQILSDGFCKAGRAAPSTSTTAFCPASGARALLPGA